MESLEAVFCYGTLIEDKVQLQLYGRLIQTKSDVLEGYTKKKIRIPDTENATFYPIIHTSKTSTDKIEGYLFKITPEELEMTDIYEGETYLRKKVILQSGIEAWCYVAR